MSNVSELKRCPKCGGPIPSEAPQGLCPKCLLQQACVPTEAGKGESAKAAPPTHEELAAQLGVNEGAVKVAIHRLRRRFREVIKNELGQTVSDHGQVDAEMHYLLEALL